MNEIQKYNTEYLEQYELLERKKVADSVSRLSNASFISSVHDIYPEIQIEKSAVYLRGKTPIKLLLLLYDKIILFLPPASKEYFFVQFGLHFDEIMILCRKGIIIPLIAHPTDYSAPYFEELLLLNPPSVWARGISILENMNIDFDEAQRVLPLKRIASFASVRKQWRMHYPNVSEDDLTINIMREISTLYADLSVFGYSDILKELLDEKIPDYKIVYYLKVLNEILTYPTLFGLGKTPVFDSDTAKRKFTVELSAKSQQLYDPSFICPSLKYILEKFDIYYQEIGLSKIMEFRRDGYVQKLQNVISDIQLSANYQCKTGCVTTNDIIVYADMLNQALDDFNKQIDTDLPAKIREFESTISCSVNFGGLSYGNILIQSTNGNNADLSSISQLGGFSSIDFLPAHIRRAVVKQSMTKFFSPEIATLWETRSKLHD